MWVATGFYAKNVSISAKRTLTFTYCIELIYLRAHSIFFIAFYWFIRPFTGSFTRIRVESRAEQLFIWDWELDVFGLPRFEPAPVRWIVIDTFDRSAIPISMSLLLGLQLFKGPYEMSIASTKYSIGSASVTPALSRAKKCIHSLRKPCNKQSFTLI